METRGQLVQIQPISAHLYHNTGLFTQKHPICEIELGSQKVRTAPCWGSGSKPSWNESFNLVRTSEGFIHFTLLNRSRVGIRHVVSEGDFYFLEQQGAVFESYIRLQSGEKEAGELKVMISLTGQVASSAYPELIPAYQSSNSYVIVKQQPLEQRHSRKGHHGRRSKRVKEVVIIPNYPPAPFVPSAVSQ